MSDGGKGDNRRPENQEAFADGYDRIFGKDHKPSRGRFIWDKEKRDFVEYSQHYSESTAPYILGDIQPYQSMVTGEMIQGRRQHREHLKSHNLIEVGNETKYISQRKAIETPAGLRETIAREVYKRG